MATDDNVRNFIGMCPKRHDYHVVVLYTSSISPFRRIWHLNRFTRVSTIFTRENQSRSVLSEKIKRPTLESLRGHDKIALCVLKPIFYAFSFVPIQVLSAVTAVTYFTKSQRSYNLIFRWFLWICDRAFCFTS